MKNGVIRIRKEINTWDHEEKQQDTGSTMSFVHSFQTPFIVKELQTGKYYQFKKTALNSHITSISWRGPFFQPMLIQTELNFQKDKLNEEKKAWRKN